MDRSELLVIGGRSGVGKTSVAHALHTRLRAESVRHAVIEGDYLDLAWPQPWEHHLSLRNLAAVWSNYRDLGYRRLVYTNTVSVLETEELAAAMGDDPLVVGVLLTAADLTAAGRLARRESGAELEAHRVRGVRSARRLDGAAPPWVHRVPTDGRTPDDVAGLIRPLLRW